MEVIQKMARTRAITVSISIPEETYILCKAIGLHMSSICAEALLKEAGKQRAYAAAYNSDYNNMYNRNIERIRASLNRKNKEKEVKKHKKTTSKVMAEFKEFLLEQQANNKLKNKEEELIEILNRFDGTADNSDNQTESEK